MARGTGIVEWMDGKPTIQYEPWLRRMAEVRALLASDPDALARFELEYAAFQAEEARLQALCLEIPAHVYESAQILPTPMRDLSEVGVEFQRWIQRSHPDYKDEPTLTVRQGIMIGFVLVAVMVGMVAYAVLRHR